MSELILGWTVVAITLALHVLTWRLHLVKRKVRNVVGLFGLALGAVAILAAAGILPSPSTWIEVGRALVLSSTIFLVYLSFYSAVELDSTSSVILLHVERSGEPGVPRSDLYGLLDDDDLVVARVKELVASRWIKGEGDTFRLAARGRLFLGLIRLTRRPFTKERMGG